MNKFFQLFLFVTVISAFTVACSGSKKATASRNDLKGTWILSHVELESSNSSNLKITSFDDVDLSCFEGSEWYFPNSGYGYYNITKSDCAAGERRIIWSQNARDGVTYLGFKHMGDLKNKQAKTVEEGYRMEVTSYEKDHFIAKSPVNFEGSTIYIVYHFNKK